MAKDATTTVPTLPETPTFQEAFAAARAEHSTSATPAAADEEHAPDDEASTGEEDEGTSPTHTGEAAPASAATATTAKDSGLLTDEEFSALQTTHADNPAQLRKALEAAFTQKTQRLADERRSVERLQQYADIIDAYEADQEGTVRALAGQLGLTFADATTATGTATTTEAGDKAPAVTQIVDAVKEALGPELEYLADPLTAAIRKVVDTLVPQSVEHAIAPLKKGQDALLNTEAERLTGGIMSKFGDTHPGWEQHEPAMLALSQKLQPNGMEEIEYLDHLYKLVTRDDVEKHLDAKVADGVKKALLKMQKGAESTERKTAATPESQVRIGPPTDRAPTFREAAAAAQRGERWD